jgi:hypothetical protein
MAIFIRDEGTSTVECLAVLAFLILVSISAMGSDIDIKDFLLSDYRLPACFPYAGDLALVSQFAEANTAYAKLMQSPVRTAANLAATVSARREFRFAPLL